MKKFFFLLFSLFLHAEGHMAPVNGIHLWYETFGEQSNPALLLIIGRGCQGILWPVELCDRLANQGFYVIRYDNRDVGLSSTIDFKKHPYDLLDMAKDAVGLLDYLHVEKAHIGGISMGGPIAELIAAHYPERVSTLTLMATSCDFRPGIRAFEGLPPEKKSLTSPRLDFLLQLRYVSTSPNLNEVEKIITYWRLLNGPVVPFEETLYRDLFQQCVARDKSKNDNHRLAIMRSEEMVRTVPHHVKVPTLIFPGTEDPLFQADHGQALAAAIPGSKYVLVQGMGHFPHTCFYDLIINTFHQHVQVAERN